MQGRLAEYLCQMQSATRDSIQFVEGMDSADFQTDIKTQRAVTMSLIILGESAAKIEEHFPEFVAEHPEIAWASIRGMRNRIAHQYHAEL